MIYHLFVCIFGDFCDFSGAWFTSEITSYSIVVTRAGQDPMKSSDFVSAIFWATNRGAPTLLLQDFGRL